MRMFLISTIFLGAIGITFSAYAILECKGVLTGFNGVRHFAVIGQVNAYVLGCGGIVLYSFGFLAYGWHLVGYYILENRAVQQE